MDANFSKYAAYFGRTPDFVRPPVAGANPQVSVGRFPPRPVGFLRQFFVPCSKVWVYVTRGMSASEMRVSGEEKHAARIELLAFSNTLFSGAHDGQDMISAVLQVLAVVPFEAGIFFAPGFTVANEEPFCSNPEMRAFLFTEPAGVEMRRLCACTPGAKLVLSVTPITLSEREYAVKHGPRGLIELFIKQGVTNLFDPFRKAVV